MVAPRNGTPVDSTTGGAGRGRVRLRRLVRTALIVVAIVVVLLVVVLAGVHTPPAKRYALQQIKTWLAAEHIDFQAAALDYNLLTLSATVNDVVVRKSSPDAAPFARIARASVDISALDLLRGRYTVNDGALVAPDIHLIVDENGEDNLPRLSESQESNAQQEAAETIDYLIARFAISNGRLRYEDRRQHLDLLLPVSLLSVAGDRTTRQHVVQLTTGQGYIALQDRTVDINRVSGELVLGQDSLHIRRFDLGAAGSTLSVAGELAPLAEPRGDLALDARLDVTRLGAFAGVAEPIGGIVRATVSAQGPLAALAVSTKIEGTDLSFRTLHQMQLSAGARYDAARQRAEVTDLTLTGPAGEVRGSGSVALAPEAGDSELSVALAGLDLSRVAEALQLEYSAASVARGDIEARWPALDYSHAVADATITVAPTRAEPRPGAVPVAGTIVAAVRGDDVSVDVRQLQSLGASVDGTLSLTDRDRIGGTLRARTEDLATVIAGAEALLGRPRGSLVGTPTAGPVTIDATLSGTIDAPGADATIDAPDVTAGTIAGIALQAQVGYASDAVTLNRADVQWDTATAHARGRMGLDGEQALDFTVDADQVAIPTALAALGRSDVPAGGMVSLQANIQGTIASPRGVVTMQGADLMAYGEPLGALSLATSLQGRRVELSELRLDKPQPGGAGRLIARGAYDLDEQRYSLSASGTDLRLTNLTLPDGRAIRGGIGLTANGEGTVEDPVGTATVTLSDVLLDEQALGNVRVDAKVSERRARVHATADTFKLTSDAEIATQSPYEATAEITLDDLDLASLPLQLETPLAGTVRARLSGSGALASPAESTATATIDRLSVVWNDQPIALEGPATLRYAGRQIAIDQLRVRAGASVASVQGTLPIDPETDGAITLDAHADLGSLAAYAPPETELKAGGTLSLQGSVRGSLQRIDPAMTLTVDNASVEMPALRQPVSNIGVRLDVADGVLRLSALDAEWGKARLGATGTVPFGWLPADLPVDLPRPDGPAEVHATVTGLDLATLPGAPAALTGIVSMKADAEAPRPDITALTGQVTFPDLQLAFSGLTLAQQDVSTIGVANGEVHVERFALDGTAGHVDLTGRVGLTGDQPLEATLGARMDLSALSSLTKRAKAGGQAAVDVSASGTVAAPGVTGYAEVTNGQVSVDEPQIAAQAVNLRVDLAPDRVTLSRLDAGVNGGTVTGNGSVALKETTFSDLDLNVSATGIALDVPLDLRSLSKADIHVTQGKAASGEGEVIVGGQVTIEEAGLTDDINLDTGVLQALTAPRSLDLTESRNPLLERVRFDVKVDTATPVVIDNNLARAEIDVDVRLLGTPYETGLSGRMDLAEGSELILNERRYAVQRGVVTFIDDRSIRPSLDLVLQTTARDYDISIQASGTPDDTTTTLSSTPALPEPDIMALLVTGRTLDEMRGEEIDVAKSQVMSYLGGRAGSQIGRGLQRATGLSTVRVEPNLIAAETDPGARLTVGQDLTEDVSLVYSTDLVNSADSIWVAEYDVTRQFTTRAVRQSDDSYRFDFRHDVQFGGEPEPARGRRTRQTVGAVTIEGSPIVAEEEIRRRFKLKTGSRYTFFAVREGIRRVGELYRERDYLQARIRAERTVRGEEVDLQLRIDPGPQIALAFEGDLPADDVMEDAREIWARGVFDTQRADDVREAIRTKLARDRYLHPTITYELGSAAETPRRVTFRVSRGVRFENVAMIFEGAGGIEPDDLEGVVHEQNLGAQVFTDPTTVVDLLQRFYRERGYLTAELDSPEYDFDTTARVARARIAVREGPLFSVRAVTTDGNQVYDTATLTREIPLVTGDPFFPATAEQSLARIRQLYWTKGYNNVRPTYTLAIDRENGVLDARFTIEEGARSVVASIDVEGTQRTGERLVQEEMEIEAGAPLNLAALGRSRQNLYGTRAFSLVDITRETESTAAATPGAGDAGSGTSAEAAQPAPSAAPQADVPVRVNVAVREVQPFQIRYGVLFDTERGVGGILDVSNHNSLGRARVIGLQSRYDSQVREARLYLNQPSLRPQPVETTASTYYRAERNPATSRADAFNVDRVGAMVQQERRLWSNYVWSYGYRFERARTYEPDLLGPRPAFVNVSPLTSTITRETRDEPLDAARGSFLSHAFSFSPRWLGSDVQFIKYFGQYFHYFPLRPPTRKRFTNEILRPRLVYAVGARVGLANGLGGNDVPLSERFLAGGSTTLRGFQQNAVGPIGTDGVPLGGEAMFVVNNELRFPLVSIVDGVVFADVGNVFQNVSDFSFSDLRESGGVGIRLRTPWLLVRLDYGFPFDRRAGESRSRFFFSIGQAF